MKKTVSYNIKKILAGAILVALPFAFGGCEKENTKPENHGGNNNQPQKHNVELVYGRTPSTQWQNIAIDTLCKYNADTTVDSIFMVLQETNQFSTIPTSILKQLRNKLIERHNVNPNKVFDKGDIELQTTSVENNPELVHFFCRHTQIQCDIS